MSRRLSDWKRIGYPKTLYLIATLSILEFVLYGCKVRQQGRLESAVNGTDGSLFGCREDASGSGVKSSLFASYIAQAVVALAGNPADPSKKVSALDITSYYSRLNHSASRIRFQAYNILLDIGGEGAFNSHGVDSGHCRAVNINSAGKFNSQFQTVPIPSLVAIRDFDHGYPFADNFASEIMMQGAPLTDKNINEIARILKPGGLARLDLVKITNVERQVVELRRKMGCERAGYSEKNGFYWRIECVKGADFGGVHRSTACIHSGSCSEEIQEVNRDKPEQEVYGVNVASANHFPEGTLDWAPRKGKITCRSGYYAMGIGSNGHMSQIICSRMPNTGPWEWSQKTMVGK